MEALSSLSKRTLKEKKKNRKSSNKCLAWNMIVSYNDLFDLI